MRGRYSGLASCLSCAHGLCQVQEQQTGRYSARMCCSRIQVRRIDTQCFVCTESCEVFMASQKCPYRNHFPATQAHILSCSTHGAFTLGERERQNVCVQFVLPVDINVHAGIWKCCSSVIRIWFTIQFIHLTFRINTSHIFLKCRIIELRNVQLNLRHVCD